MRAPRPNATTGAWVGDAGEGDGRDSRANHGDSRAEAPRTVAACFAKERCTGHRQEGRRRESAKKGTQSRERRADDHRARTGATLPHRARTFTCKSRRIANSGAPHVCDVIHDERRRAPLGAPRRGPREGRSRAARRRMATPLRKRQKQASRSARQVLTLWATPDARAERARTRLIMLRLPRAPNAEPVARFRSEA